MTASWPAIAAVLTVAALTFIVVAYRRRWDWTGFVGRSIPKSPKEEVVPPKTLWDWAHLLVIPAGLFLVGVVFNDWQSQREATRADARTVVDRSIARDAQQEEAMHDYLDEMTVLLLENELRDAPVGAEVRTVARIRTLATLRSVDGARKGIVLRFLKESLLIARSAQEGPRAEHTNPIVDLVGADLSGAKLAFADLSEIDLTGVDLSGAEMNRVDLFGAEMYETVFRNSCLRGALLVEGHIERTDFGSADMSNANLYRASGWGPVFDGANLSGVNGGEVDLQFPEMNAIVTDADTFFESADLPVTQAPTGSVGAMTQFEHCLAAPGHEPISAFGSAVR